MSSITIGGVTVNAGERKSIDLSLPTLYSHSPVCMPVHVINGKESGPTLFVSAAIHGDEINGVEVIRRLLKRKCMKQVKGILILVPVVNIYGFISQSRYLPDRRDLNRSFPGSEAGSMASRLAYTFMQEIVSKCTHGIDLHTGAIGRENLPQIRAKVVGSPETEAMARAFNAPVIMNSELLDGSLREAVAKDKTPILLYEAGEALRFDETCIRAGVSGIVNVMRHLKMLPKKKPKRDPQNILIAKSSKWVRAPQSGILRSIVPMGERVHTGDTIGWVSDPFGEQEQEVSSPISGIIIGKSNLPLVHEGEALFHIAKFDENDTVADSVEEFQEQHDPQTDAEESQEPVIF